MAIACLGLGLPGNTYANGIGVMLGTYGAMCSTWVQGVHPGCVRPNMWAWRARGRDRRAEVNQGRARIHGGLNCSLNGCMN